MIADKKGRGRGGEFLSRVSVTRLSLCTYTLKLGKTRKGGGGGGGWGGFLLSVVVSVRRSNNWGRGGSQTRENKRKRVFFFSHSIGETVSLPALALLTSNLSD